MALIPYTKPYLPIPKQLDLLAERGMCIGDAVLASACLERIGYYRLSGYWYPFRKSCLINNPSPGRPSRLVGDDFRPGTTFAQVMALYTFDKRLRLMLLNAIERVEVALRVDIALVLGKRNPWAHRDASQLHGNFSRRRRSGRTGHEEWLDRVDDGYQRSKEEFVKHHRAKYEDNPPIWIAIELWDFGILSFILEGMKISDQRQLAQKYGLPRVELLPSWARSINHLRNICAHHCRLWNRSPADQAAPPRPGEIPFFDHLINDQNAKARIYLTLAVIQFILKTINPSTSWDSRLKDLIRTFPAGNGIKIAQAGFPDSWQEQPLWT